MEGLWGGALAHCVETEEPELVQLGEGIALGNSDSSPRVYAEVIRKMEPVATEVHGVRVRDNRQN